ncbi:MAG: Ribbon-helix-helix protein copG family [Solirubrobacterales bacterium]|jgi:antitoxin component of RelBE/YafQ-DinJ toxin-antitoxin module|nr:Ribbon-helix-helix protein copG family [Solirubrobacterales bacterium]
MATKVLSLRLPEEIAVEIAAVARANGVSVSRAIRMAIEDYVAAQRSDKAFKARLKQRLEEDRELLERLTE